MVEPIGSQLTPRVPANIGMDAARVDPTENKRVDWMAHKDARLGAALAYYSIFSLGPLTIIAMAVAGLFFGRDAVQAQVAEAIWETAEPRPSRLCWQGPQNPAKG